MKYFKRKQLGRLTFFGKDDLLLNDANSIVDDGTTIKKNYEFFIDNMYDVEFSNNVLMCVESFNLYENGIGGNLKLRCININNNNNWDSDGTVKKPILIWEGYVDNRMWNSKSSQSYVFKVPRNIVQNNRIGFELEVNKSDVAISTTATETTTETGVLFPRYAATDDTYVDANGRTIRFYTSSVWNDSTKAYKIGNKLLTGTYQQYQSGAYKYEDINNITPSGNTNLTYLYGKFNYGFPDGYKGEYVMWDFAEEFVLKELKIAVYATNNVGTPERFKIKGSNDPNCWQTPSNTSWTDIFEYNYNQTLTVWSAIGEYKSFSITNTIPYRFYVIIVNEIYKSNWGDFIIGEIEFQGDISTTTTINATTNDLTNDELKKISISTVVYDADE